MMDEEDEIIESLKKAETIMNQTTEQLLATYIEKLESRLEELEATVKILEERTVKLYEYEWADDLALG